MVKLRLLSKRICICKGVILKTGTFTFFVFLLSSFTYGQSGNKSSFTVEEISKKSNSEFKELRIGDKVPDIEFAMLNYPTQKARLSDFKGKLIILDYWATWCSSCLKQFPKLDSLQRQFKDVKILLVNSKRTGDTEEKIKSFLEKRKIIKGVAWQLSIVVNDSVSISFFPIGCFLTT